MNFEGILDFWFQDDVRDKWFRSTPEFDAHIRRQFESLWEQAGAGELDSWQASADGALALAIVLDQFPLNMFRGEARAFSTEAKAIEVAKAAIDNGLDQQLPADRLMFLFMPLMHSESLADQTLSVEKFTAAGMEESARFARHHYGIVEKYGRFPHRNAILGRESTPEEQAYLASDEAFLG